MLERCKEFRFYRMCGLVVALAAAMGHAASEVNAAPRVEFELCTAPGLSPTAAQDWLRALEGLELDGLRIRELVGSDRPNVDTTGSGAAARYRVTGIIAGKNELRLPGGVFGVSDKTKLLKWIEKLKEGGAESLTAKTGAFGFTNKQLVELHTTLAVKLNASTTGLPTADVVRTIGSRIDLPLTVAPEVRNRFPDETVADELEGMTAGTALAAVVRPLGLVVVPQFQAGGMKLLDRKSVV